MASLTAAQADQLLDKLSTDDAFRADYEKDPGAALDKLGIPKNCHGCMKKKLPSKQAFKDARAALKQQLTAKLDQSVFAVGK